jgi:hypothetical protein
VQEKSYRKARPNARSSLWDSRRYQIGGRLAQRQPPDWKSSERKLTFSEKKIDVQSTRSILHRRKSCGKKIDVPGDQHLFHSFVAKAWFDSTAVNPVKED